MLCDILTMRIVFEGHGEKNVCYEKIGCYNMCCVIFKCEVLSITIIRMGKVHTAKHCLGTGCP